MANGLGMCLRPLGLPYPQVADGLVPLPRGLRNVISPSLLEGRGAYALYDLSLSGREGYGGILQSL